MKGWITKIAIGVFAAAVVIVSLTWFTVRSSLPQLDGTLVVEGVSAPVSIVRDRDGIPTITGDNRYDVAYALGFAHGQDRYFQMDLIRRDAAGELSEVVGPPTLEIDKRKRLHRFRARAEADLIAAATGIHNVIAPQCIDLVAPGRALDLIGAAVDKIKRLIDLGVLVQEQTGIDLQAFDTEDKLPVYEMVIGGDCACDR